MRKTIYSTGLLMLAAALFGAEEAGAADRNCRNNGNGGKLAIIGLTSDQRLICFSDNSPAGAGEIGEISGLSGDTRLVGIDYRPATGELYGLGDRGGLYVLDTRDAGATFKSQLNVALSGTSFGIDFNPTVDRLRIVSDTGQNLRVNVTDGTTTTDTTLATTAPETATGITGVAYTNNDADANTGTTLYGIDTRLDQLVIQAPPNAGIINPTGKLTVDTTAAAGFDIYSRTNGGSTGDVEAYATLTVDGRSRLYRINLFTGRATARGQFRAGDQVIGIAIPTRQ
ncbi:MAG TPA: DUF4394 domain-containing protein [Thermoanaerobaculia bacterium]|nr:DUF4394 domain-containing protein [Thermoanaerobaculia bacterium]